jgi:predicted aspartyl protease
MLLRRPIPIALVAVLLVATGVARPASKTTNKEAAHLDMLIEKRENPELERLLPQAKLDETERTYFEGVLANRRNQLEKSIELLQKVLPALKTTEPKRAAVAARSLADDYTKTFQYEKADRVYNELRTDYSKLLPAAERQSLKDDGKTVHLLTNAPPQTVSVESAFSIPIHLGDLGTIESDLAVNGVAKSWILDTGANYSVLTESAAKQMGLKLSEQAAQTQGASGAENPLHVAVVPEMKIGSAVIRNMVVLVLPDKALLVPIPKGKHQIEAILGYPVLSALGQLTFTPDALKVDTGGDSSGAVMYMQELNPLVECRVNGHDMLLFFDTGASTTALTARYYNQYPAELANAVKGRRGVAGAGGIKYMSIYTLPKVQFQIAGQTAVLDKVAVSPEPMGTDFDLLYGTLGRDLTAMFKSFTFDFRSMRFRLEK